MQAQRTPGALWPCLALTSFICTPQHCECHRPACSISEAPSNRTFPLLLSNSNVQPLAPAQSGAHHPPSLSRSFHLIPPPPFPRQEFSPHPTTPQTIGIADGWSCFCKIRIYKGHNLQFVNLGRNFHFLYFKNAPQFRSTSPVRKCKEGTGHTV